MDGSHRLIKTLSGLVVAMTSTAALLGWINPASSIAPSQVPLADLRESARSVVLEGIDDISEHWLDVAVHCVAFAPTGLLAATQPGADYHFHVDASGQPTRTPRWRRQQADRRAPHTIRIQVQAATDREELSGAQTATVQAIVETLDDLRPVQLDPLRVFEQPRSAAASSRGTQFLGQRL